MTPREIKNRKIKFGIGYSRRDTNDFIDEVYEEFEALYKENEDLREKISILSEGLQYYKSMEKTMQKAMVLAQKACDEKQEEAVKRAKNIETQAELRATEALNKAKNDLDKIYTKADDLNRKFMLYKSQIKDLLESQIKLLNSDVYDVAINDLDDYLKIKDNLDSTEEADDLKKAGEVFKNLTKELYE